MNSAQLALTAVQLVARRGGVALSELARELQVPRSTAHRILTNCVAVGYVRQEHSGGRYVPGPALHDLALGMASAVTMHDIVSPILSELRAELDLTTSISVLEGRAVRVVASLEGGGLRHLGSQLGRVCPAHATAAGKAILAFCAPAALARRYPGRNLATVTDRTITDWDKLLRELRTIRARGWATSIGESDPVINGVAVPVMTLSGDAEAAVCVVAFAPRLCTRSEILDVVNPLLGAASRIERLVRQSHLPPGDSDMGGSDATPPFRIAELECDRLAAYEAQRL